MYIDSFSSPAGQMRICANENAITEISFTDEPMPCKPHRLIDFCKNQLQEYFSGKRKNFDLPLQFSGTDFQQIVWLALQKIPFGTVKTYAQLAALLGDPKAIRAVAAANGKNKFAIAVPCHRIMGAGGNLTGYAWGLNRKNWLLAHEGVSTQSLF